MCLPGDVMNQYILKYTKFRHFKGFFYIQKTTIKAKYVKNVYQVLSQKDFSSNTWIYNTHLREEKG